MIKSNENDKAERLKGILQEIKNLAYEAEDLVWKTSEEDRAKSYWLSHILSALDNDHDYLGGSMITMQDTIDALSDETN